MKPENANPSPLDSDTTITEFKINGGVIRVPFSRKQLSQFRAGSMAALAVKPEKPIPLSGKLYPFIVFPVRLTPAWDLKQIGDGIPCDNVAQANDFVEAIRGKT